MVVFSMKEQQQQTDVKYVIHYYFDNHKYDLKVPARWEPSADEVYATIRRQRDEAKRLGIDRLIVKHVLLQKLETYRQSIVDVDGLNYVSSIETPKL